MNRLLNYLFLLWHKFFPQGCVIFLNKVQTACISFFECVLCCRVLQLCGAKPSAEVILHCDPETCCCCSFCPWSRVECSISSAVQPPQEGAVSSLALYADDGTTFASMCEMYYFTFSFGCCLLFDLFIHLLN